MVVDLAGLTFIDSSGINALVRAASTVEARGGTAVLAAPSPAARRVFEITAESQVVTVVAEPCGRRGAPAASEERR